MSFTHWQDELNARNHQLVYDWNLRRDKLVRPDPNRTRSKIPLRIVSKPDAGCIHYNRRVFRNTVEIFASKVTGRSLRFTDCTFCGAVDLRAFSQTKNLVFICCDFHRHVEGSNTTYGGNVTFIGCHFQRSMTLAESVFPRGLSVAFSFIGMEEIEPAVRAFAEFHEAPMKIRSAWWPGIRVTGMLRLDRTVVAGSLNLAEARIHGPLLMRSIEIGAQWRISLSASSVGPNYTQRGRLHLRQLRVAGDVELSPHVQSRDIRTAQRSIIHGSMVLASSNINGRLDVRGAQIHGRLHLPHAHIRDRLEANVWLHDDDKKHEHAFRTEVRGRGGVSVRMADAVVGHGVWFDGAELTGQFNAKNARVGGDFYLRQARDHGRDLPLLRGCVVRASTSNPNDPVSPRINEAMRLQGASIGGTLDLTWTEFDGVVNLENVHVGADLHMRGVFVGPIQEKQKVRGGFVTKMGMARIGRTLDFRGSHFGGDIQAHGIEIKGDIRFGTWERRLVQDNIGVDGALVEPSDSELAAPGVYQNARYYGLVDLSNADVDGELKCCCGVFDGDFKGRGIRIGHRCSFSGGVFRGRVLFDDAAIEGTVEIGDGETRQRVGTYFGLGLSLQRARIGGNVLYFRASFGVAPLDTALGGAATARQATLRSEWPRFLRGALQLARHGGRAENRELTAVKSLAAITLDARLAIVTGAWYRIEESSSTSANVLRGRLNGANFRVHGDFALKGFAIDGSLFFDSINVGGDFLFAGTRVSGDLDMSGGVVDGAAFEQIPAGGAPLNLRTEPPSPFVRGNVHLERVRIRNLFLRLEENDYPPASKTCAVGEKRRGPASVWLEHANIGLFTLAGKLPFDEPPHLWMKGLRFDELHVANLEAKLDRNLQPRGFTRWGCRRSKWYFWAWPTPSASFLGALTVYAGLLACLSGKWRVELAVVGFSIVALVYILWKGAKFASPWYPRAEALFLRQMPEVDFGLYARTEKWLRSRGRDEDANFVYLWRRLLQIESGILALLFHRFHAWRHRNDKNLGKYIEEMLAATSRGRQAFVHRCKFLEWRDAALREIGKDKSARASWESKTRREVWEELNRRLAGTAQRLRDWALLTMVGDGVRVAPALTVFLMLFGFSWLFVFSSRDSVERPATFMVPPDYGEVTSANPHGPVEQAWTENPRWREGMGTADRDWTLKDSLWVSLSTHVPLVNLAAREKWRPSSNRVATFVALSPFDALVPRYDTWAGMVRFFGWITVPIILASITGLLRRRPTEVESEWSE